MSRLDELNHKLEQQYADTLEESTAAKAAKSDAERRADEMDGQQQQTVAEVNCHPSQAEVSNGNSCDLLGEKTGA